MVDAVTGAGASRRRIGVANAGLTSLLLILFLTFLDNTVISAVLANVQAQLHCGVAALQWIVGGYALAFASLMLICGAMGDNYGRRRLMVIGLVVFCAGSVLCAMATSSGMLIAGRVVMGAGAAASEPGTLSMIRHIYPESRHRARALGAWAAVSGLALAIGPVLGGVLTGIWSWRAIFWFNVVFGIVAIVLARATLPESSDPSRVRPDYRGFFLLAVALGAATYATISGESSGYLASGPDLLFAVSLLSLGVFFVVEHRARQPMLLIEFFKRPAFAGSNFVALTSYFSILSIFFFVALYLEIVASAGAYQLAQDFLPLLGGMVIASIVSGRWVGWAGSRIPMTVGCAVAALGVFLTDLRISPHAGLLAVGWTMGIAGIGFGLLVVPVTSSALVSVPAEHSSMAASMTNTSRELGAVAGVAILGSVVNGQLTVQLTQRLIQIGVPVAYRNEVITAVTTGTISARIKGLGHTTAAVQAIINKVVAAAYSAFRHGLDLALISSTVLLVISAVVAYSTGTSGGDELV
ncbi:MAG TPA: MFS transporter [Acidimicrobiales bacterium]|nr:MFS transporter [Acidimicrobiales bacterium]